MFIKRELPPLVVSVKMVWNYADHNAFTDLCHHDGQFYLVFREADTHEKGENGVIRILTSPDGVEWTSKKVLSEPGVDLRDPKLSVMPDGRLHLLVGGTEVDESGTTTQASTRVAFGDDKLNFTPFESVLMQNRWLWRLTWYQGIGYGIAYDTSESDWTAALYKTTDGLNFRKIVSFDIDGDPSEATIRFTDEGEMKALIRRSGGWSHHALMGRAYPPYNEWEWADTGYSIGGPNFLILKGEQQWISGRLLYGNPWGVFAKTALLSYDDNYLKRELLLPSFGDTSYPGLVYHDNFLWVSYYSSHEKKTAIYVAKILINTGA